MSNGHESAQSRRSLRQARETSAEDQSPPQETRPADPGAPSLPRTPANPAATGEAERTAEAPQRERRSRRAANVPVDAPPSTQSRERISQARARNRETLRNYRALADQQPERQGDIPTRRQLRLQQQAAVREQVNQDPGEDVDQTPAPAQPADLGASAESQGGAADADELTVEQALAARQAIIGQAQNQVAMMEAAAKDDPFSVDLEILAQQKALAERAAILNTRAQKIQQLTQENQQRKPLLNDPTTAHNLSIVSPVEFVRSSGAEDPSSPAPSTSHIPVVTGAMSKQYRTATGAVAAAVVPKGSVRNERGVEPVVTAPAVPQEQPLSALSPDSAGRSRVLAQAEAMVREQRRPGSDGATPIRARSAYGLEPLDAMTAGLARVQRMRIVQYSVVGLGALALITGIMMIVGGFGG